MASFIACFFHTSGQFTSVQQVSVTLRLFSPFRVLGKQTAPDNSKRDASAAADDDPFYLCDCKTRAEIAPASTAITYRISYKPRQLHLIDWLRRLAQGCFHGVSTALSGAGKKAGSKHPRTICQNQFFNEAHTITTIPAAPPISSLFILVLVLRYLFFFRLFLSSAFSSGFCQSNLLKLFDLSSHLHSFSIKQVSQGGICQTFLSMRNVVHEPCFV